MRRQRGFTLIELVMIIVILGILAAVAIPIYFNLAGQANAAAERGVVGGVRAGISTFLANSATHIFPGALDTAAVGVCTTTGVNACFATVLAQGGIYDGSWTKVSATTYRGPNFAVNGITYTYTAATGAFQ